jgi:hypothetical protein
MKTRMTKQEMVYEFMISLTANASIFDDWNNSDYELGGYGEHIKALAEEMADAYLQENT